MNETGEEGVGREVWEETGLKVEKATISSPCRTFISIPAFPFIRSICSFSVP